MVSVAYISGEREAAEEGSSGANARSSRARGTVCSMYTGIQCTCTYMWLVRLDYGV